ncbi:hypothetical protein WR25_01421 isoform C [Diploscapter pachys]|uniref:F-box domain-containing protein n=1 Tax=Diploscapter pachys TaxID=2018661 RepID=A0A2A2JP64_9BILA|nr:hypothetical protein WR25_01421 isoform C [Diploscapter pachys]
MENVATTSQRNLEVSQRIFWNNLPPELRLEILKKTGFAGIQNSRLVDKTTHRLIQSNREFLTRRRISIKIRNVTRRSVLLKSSSKEEDEAHLKRHEIFSSQLANMGKRRHSGDSEEYGGKRRRFSENDHLSSFVSTPTSSFPSTSFEDSESHDAILSPALLDRLQKLVKNCEIDKLKFDEADLTDSDLKKLQSLLKSRRIKRLDFVLCSFAKITSDTFHNFVKKLNPSLVNISLINRCEERGFFSTEFMQFLTTRQAFGVYDVPVPLTLTDEMLASMKCGNFRIGDTHNLTALGISKFIERIKSGDISIENVVIDLNDPLKSSIIEIFPGFDKRKSANSVGFKNFHWNS